ncbi:MAG: oligosaccharide flippase family protein [Dehalococcoidia bacterium]
MEERQEPGAVARSVARNSLVQLVGRGMTMAVAVGTLTLLSRYLGPHDFGQYQFVIAFVLLVNLSDLGVSSIAVRHLSTMERDPDDLMGNVITVRTTLAGLAVAVAITIAFVLGYSTETKVAIGVASLSFPFAILSVSYTAAFAANLRMEYASLGNVAQGLTTLVGMGLVVLAGGGLVPLLAAFSAGFFANSLVCLLFVRRFVRPQFRYDAAYCRKILRDAIPLGLAVIVVTAYERMGVLFLNAFTDSGDGAVGYYTFAYRLVDLAFPLSFMFVGSVYPLLSAHHGKDEMREFRRLYQRSQDLLAVCAVSVSLGVMLFAHPMVQLIGGDQFLPAVRNLRIVSAAFAFIWVSSLVNYSLIAVGRQTMLIPIAFVGLAVNLGVNLTLIPAFGSEGAAAATASTEAAVLACGLFVLSRYIGGLPSFSVAGKLLTVSGIITGVLWALPLHWIPEAAIAIVLLVVGVAVSRVVSAEEVRMLLRPRAAAREVATQPAVIGN